MKRVETRALGGVSCCGMGKWRGARKREGGDHEEMRLHENTNDVKNPSAESAIPGRPLHRSYFRGTGKAEVGWQWVSKRR